MGSYIQRPIDPDIEAGSATSYGTGMEASGAGEMALTTEPRIAIQES